MAILPGKTPRRIYVSGHYDSLNLGSAGGPALSTRVRSPRRARRRAAARPAVAGGEAAGRARRPGRRPSAAIRSRRHGQNYNIDAPGANDDGSGTVLTMELARVFAESGIEFDATLVFMAVAGEEQGLHRVARAREDGAGRRTIPIQAVFNNDIVGNSRRRRRHRRRRDDPRLLGGAGGLAVAIARACSRSAWRRGYVPSHGSG